MSSCRIQLTASCQIEVPTQAIEAFCQRWQVQRLELFGSVLRSDFRPDSDVDFLVQFQPEARRSLPDLVQMEGELEEFSGGMSI